MYWFSWKKKCVWKCRLKDGVHGFRPQCVIAWHQGAVSLTFRELSKEILRKYTMPKIPFMVKISSWNFVRVPKAWLWAHLQSFSLKFSQVRFLRYTNFERKFWRARETLVKRPPGFPCVNRATALDTVHTLSLCEILYRNAERSLTYHRRNKMANIWQMSFLNTFSRLKTAIFWFIFHWSLFILSRLATNWGMVWRQTATKLLPEQIMTQLTDAYISIKHNSSNSIFCWITAICI